MQTVRMLPKPDPLQPDQTAVQRGLYILGFVISHRLTATISDIDLELADHAGIVASAGRYDIGATYDTISEARHLISRTLLVRRETAHQPADVPPVVLDPENAGPMARLLDQPVPQPPAPAHAVRQYDNIAF